VTKLRSEFDRKQWKDCCGKGCKKCEIAQAYIGRYGHKDGLEKLAGDRKAVLKSAKKGGAAKSGKARGGKARKKARA